MAANRDRSTRLLVNGKPSSARADPGTPLMYVLRNDSAAKGPRFGCGLGQCGACTVHVDGFAVRSCVMPVSAASGKTITTLDGLAASYTAKNKAAPPGTLHPVQRAFIDFQAMQCGYCSNGWIMTAAAFLDHTPRPDEAAIRRALSGLKCRCGAHMAMLRAVRKAASDMA